MPACPICASSQTVKNGRIHNGKQWFKCRECGRQNVRATKEKSHVVTVWFNRHSIFPPYNLRHCWAIWTL